MAAPGWTSFGVLALSLVFFLSVVCSEALSYPSKDNLDTGSPVEYVRHMKRVERTPEKPLGRRQKRAADQPDGSSSTRCDNNDYTEQVKGGATKFTFHNETNLSVSMTWAGENNGVLLVLTTDEWGPFVGPTMLWRSADYGKTFQNISKKINNAYIKKDNGMYKSLLDPGRVLLVSYMSDGESAGSRIYVTTDGGETFDGITLNFNVDTIQFHLKNKDYLLAHTSQNDHSLYLSKDFGRTWSKVHDYVADFKWGTASYDTESTIYLTYDPKHMASAGMYRPSNLNSDIDYYDDYGIWGLEHPRPESYNFDLLKSTDLGKNFVVVAEHVYSFGQQGQFLYVSIELNENNFTRVMHVSRDGGGTWELAQLPSITPDRFYSILDMSEGMVFMHVDDEGDTGTGTIYTSGADGIIFSVSLTSHLYPNFESVTDFYKVKSLRGVYLASQIRKDKSIRTMITYDRGGVWQPVPTPAGMSCEKPSDQCGLQIHNQYSRVKGINAPMGPLSEPNAVGLILVHGHVSDALQTTNPDVYISDDGGYNWFKALDGPHHYAIGDHGGLLVAVPVSADRLANTIRYSFDEGQCWKDYKFTEEEIVFTGLLTEPGAKTMKVGIWGFGRDDHKWRVTVIDFEKVITRQCTDDDYDTWLAHEEYHKEGLEDACLLGVKETYRRRKKNTMCKNGYSYEVQGEKHRCTCMDADYECEYGFHRDSDNRCTADTDYISKFPEVCENGELQEIKSNGYRLIPGDECVGGTPPQTSLVDLRERCNKQERFEEGYGLANFKTYFNREGVGGKVVAGLTVTVILTALLIILVYYGKRWWRRKQNQEVYRYSELNQTDDVSLEEDHSSKTWVYHDDSDVDLLP
ncbi:SORT1 [Branchiostoma lanceolatum]|uniref:SORT1 protein n=1 Tax=Branchiostoma lanceolatum TaxID=7740 RepID=A0A8K0EWB0_BRALA|nr:SORT1 [Branchiostoma lanceolatum]